jgi:putative copper resistance protein D
MEKLLHSVSGALHILAAVTWIGSMIYSEFAVMPALKQLGASHL